VTAAWSAQSPDFYHTDFWLGGTDFKRSMLAVFIVLAQAPANPQSRRSQKRD